VSLAVVYDVADAPDAWFENVLTDPPFRSAEWWSAFRCGNVPVRVLRGVISKVFWSGHGDYPEFTMATDDRQELDFTREGDLSRYVEGLRAEVHTVTQRFKREPAALFAPSMMGQEWPLVVRILIEESELRSDPTPPRERDRGRDASARDEPRP
jgi:hypothetical protein